MSDLPPLPKGFTLDGEAPQAALPPLPNGYKLDEAQAAPPAEAPPETGGAISDIGPEMGNTFLGHVGNIAGAYGQTANNPSAISQTLNTGKAIASALGVIPDTLIGAPLRSLLGHGMATAEHAVGSVIAPETAAKDNPQEMYDTAKGNVDTAMAALATKGTKLVPAKVTTPQLYQYAEAGYNHPQVKALTYTPDAMANLSKDLQQTMLQNKVDKFVAPTVDGIVKRIQEPRFGGNSTYDDLQMARESLNAIPPGDKEYRAAAVVRRALDDYVAAPNQGDLISGDASKAGPILQDARNNYAAAKKSEAFDTREANAEYKTNDSNSAMNLENNLRKQVTQILTDPKKQRGLSPDVIDALKAYNKGDRTANTMRLVSNLGGGGGGLGAVVAGGVGSLLGLGPYLLPSAAMGLKAAGNARAASQFGKIADMMRQESALARSLPKIVTPLAHPASGILPGGFLPQLAARGGLFPLPRYLPANADNN